MNKHIARNFRVAVATLAVGAALTGAITHGVEIDRASAKLKAAPTLIQVSPDHEHELTIIGSDTAFELPAQLPAGLTRLTFRNDASYSNAPQIMRLPEGLTLEDALSEEIAEDSAPSWFLSSIAVGSPGFTLAGNSASLVIDLEPGEYIVFSLENPTLTTGFAAIPDSGASVEEPVSIGEVVLDEMSIAVPEHIAAGEQVWKVVNNGDQLHELAIVRVPDGTSLDQLLVLLNSDPASPPTGALDPASFVDVGGLGFLSPNHAAWTTLNLEPGTYFAVCWVPDLGSGAPHAMLGMISLFTVED